MAYSDSNYNKTKEISAKIFLSYDGAAAAARWGLKYDKDRIYLKFLNKDMYVDRNDGSVIITDGPADNQDSSDGKTPQPADFSAAIKAPMPADFNVAMSVYDLLCYSSERPVLSGSYVPLNSLSKAQTSWVSENHIFGKKQAAIFSGNEAGLENALKRIHALQLNADSSNSFKTAGADLAAYIPVFGPIMCLFKYWQADEEFPASLTVYWDENILSLMHFETVWYASVAVINRLKELAED